jgi:hypothetical protein
VLNSQVIEELPGNLRNTTDSAVKRHFVGPGRRAKSADLTDELKGGIIQLLIRWGAVRLPEYFDVSAHAGIS